ncbi:hypothetical protein [Hymenobacter sp. DG01]|nr:hypothetical protein [Hymenobacter sp. DG01]
MINSHNTQRSFEGIRRPDGTNMTVGTLGTLAGTVMTIVAGK